MKSKYLLPNRFRTIGWILLIPFSVLGIAHIHSDFSFEFLSYTVSTAPFEWNDGNFTNEIAAIGVLIALIMIAFSREKIEDEFTMQLRLDSLIMAVWINYILLFLTILLVYGEWFFIAMVYNMYTVLIIFIARFYWIKSRVGKYDMV